MLRVCHILKLLDFGNMVVILLKVGDIIFFDWENDGEADHTGIVEKTENNNEIYFLYIKTDTKLRKSA